MSRCYMDTGGRRMLIHEADNLRVARERWIVAVESALPT